MNFPLTSHCQLGKNAVGEPYKGKGAEGLTTHTTVAGNQLIQAFVLNLDLAVAVPDFRADYHSLAKIRL